MARIYDYPKVIILVRLTSTKGNRWPGIAYHSNPHRRENFQHLCYNGILLSSTLTPSKLDCSILSMSVWWNVSCNQELPQIRENIYWHAWLTLRDRERAGGNKSIIYDYRNHIIEALIINICPTSNDPAPDKSGHRVWVCNQAF